MPCHGCPREMTEMCNEMVANIHGVSAGQINALGMLVLIRRDTFVSTEEALSMRGIAISDRAISLTQQRGICIFKIGISRDPYHRMYNPVFGYTQRGELYDRMDLLVASYPAVCGHLERLCISRMQGLPRVSQRQPRR